MGGEKGKGGGRRREEGGEGKERGFAKEDGEEDGQEERKGEGKRPGKGKGRSVLLDVRYHKEACETDDRPPATCDHKTHMRLAFHGADRECTYVTNGYRSAHGPAHCIDNVY